MKSSSCLILLGLFSTLISSPDPLAAPPGPKYEFQSTPGVELKLNEVKREKRGKVTYVYYNLMAKGLTPGQNLDLYQWVWTLSDGVLSQTGYRVDSDGKVICSTPEEAHPGEEKSKQWCRGTLGETRLGAVGFQWGQAFRVGLISPGGEVKGFAEVFPFPIETDDQGCHLTAERVSEKADAWSITGDGFKPGDTVHWVMKGAAGSHEADAKLTDKGKLAILIRPPESGGASGGSVSLKVEASRCKPVLHFKWGISAIEFP